MKVKTYLFWIPCHSADGLATVIIQSKTLFLGFHVPDGDKSSASACDQDMGDFFIPIQTFNVVGTCGSISETERVVDII